MNRNKNSIGLLMLSLAGLVVAFGCNQNPTANTSQSSTDSTSTVALAGKTADVGCCGKCATEQVAVGQAGCCGKCSDEAASKTSEGCCGKCAAELGSETASKPKEGCEGNCNACAEGDSANCKCGDAPVAKPAADETDKGVSHVNSMPEDREIFHFLLESHEKITRTVEELDNGVQTVTESTDPVVAGKIQEHVASMYQRVEDGRPLRMWDELYREIFKHADKIKMEINNTENGISVTETSEDEYVVKLIKSHAKVVTGFSEKGFDEARLNHEPPTK